MALTKLNNNGIAGVTALPSSIALGDMVLVSSATASSSASLSFTLGDYKEYQFYFVNIHPANDNNLFRTNFSIDNGSNYNVVKTTTYFMAGHSEADDYSVLQYRTSDDVAQSTADFPIFNNGLGGDNDQSYSGSMSIFNPSSDTFVKHFMVNGNGSIDNNTSINAFMAGYANTQSALTNIKFLMSSGNIDSGTILMYGIN